MPTLLIFTMHGTTPWWTYIGRALKVVKKSVILSDIRGDGDISVVDDFYRYMRRPDARTIAEARLGLIGCEDVIRRCRTLRSLDRQMALTMIGGMWQALEDAVVRVRPNLIMSFTIDRYVMDLLERVGRRHGIQFLEMTASILSNKIMFLQRGRLLPLRQPGEDEVIEAVHELIAPDFAPSYVKASNRFSRYQYIKVFLYYELRGFVFNIIRWMRRDPRNLHYLDAQKSLAHKVKMRDWVVLRYFNNAGWEVRLESASADKRIFLGLQLFPEASLDYWLTDPELLSHDDTVIELCETLGAAGFSIFVKDHPLQFGFRQRDLIEKLRRLTFVTLVPYEVSAAYLLSRCRVSVTFTGTIGFQAAMAGLVSVVCDPYYATPAHFIHFRCRADITRLPGQIAEFVMPESLESTRLSLTRRLLAGSAPGQYFSFMQFDPRTETDRARVHSLLQSLDAYLPSFFRDFQDVAMGVEATKQL